MSGNHSQVFPASDSRLYQLVLEVLDKVDRVERQLASAATETVPEQVLFTTRSAAAFVDVSAKTLERKIRSGEIPAQRLKGSGKRGRYYIHRDVLLSQFEPIEDAHSSKSSAKGKSSASRKLVATSAKS